jgi:outer membrane immunogenic protein
MGSSEMKKILLASVATIALCGASAFAADRPMPYKAAPAAPVFSWTGCYAGVEGGGNWGKRHDTTEDGTDFVRHNLSGGLAGGTLGCNYQSGSLVWGLEGDFSWTNKDGSSPSLLTPAFINSTKEKWFATERARVGFAANNWLLYVTGGAAEASVHVIDTNGVLFDAQTKTLSGWTVGGGVEAALGNNWSAKLEFLHADFGRKTFFPDSAATIPHRVDIRDNILRVGLNWKFGDWGKGPVSARY